MPKKYLLGFTLAELLIAVAILGEIATFTIPKILSAQQNGQRIATFRETIGTLNALVYQGYITGDVTSNSQFPSYLMDKMNTTKICSTNATTEGCWTQASSTGQEGYPGLVLHNGTTITGLDYFSGSRAVFALDWNGTAGSNTLGDDEILVEACLAKTGCTFGQRAGTIVPFSGDTPSQTLFTTIFNR